jgi:tetratricopeptide (TPR) repeat protein
MLVRIATALVTLSFCASAADVPKATDAESTQQRAARLLNDAARNDATQSQTNQQAAEAAFQSGLKLMNDLDYEEARVFFERALTLVPNYAPARAKLRTIESLLGIHTQRIGEKLRELENESRVQKQEALIEIENLIAEARRYEEKATVLPYNSESMTRADVMAEQLKNLQKAQERLRRAKDLLNWLPPYIKAPEERANVDEGLKRLGK